MAKFEEFEEFEDDFEGYGDSSRRWGLNIFSKKSLFLLLLPVLVLLTIVFFFLVLTPKSSSSVSSSVNLDDYKVTYQIELNEEQYLEKRVKSYENYLVNWVSSYVGRGGRDGLNTNSLRTTPMQDKGSFVSVENLNVVYPNLNGVIENVYISYYYNKDEKELIQSVGIDKTDGSQRYVYVIYSEGLDVLDYYVTNGAIKVNE